MDTACREVSQNALTGTSRVVMIFSDRSSHPRSTAQDRPFQASRVSRVSRIPCENTCWLALIGQSSAVEGGRLRVELRGLEPLTFALPARRSSS